MKEFLENHPTREVLEFKPSVVAIVGLPLTGKSTLGRRLAAVSNFTFLDVDIARQEVFSRSQTETVLPDEQEAAAMLESYKRNHEKAKGLLQAGLAVILVATYSKPIYHQMLVELVEKQGIPLKVILLSCSGEEIKRRIDHRNAVGDFSNVRTVDHYNRDKERYQKISGVDLLELDTERPIEESLEDIVDFIEELKVK